MKGNGWVLIGWGVLALCALVLLLSGCGVHRCVVSPAVAGGAEQEVPQVVPIIDDAGLVVDLVEEGQVLPVVRSSWGRHWVATPQLVEGWIGKEMCR